MTLNPSETEPKANKFTQECIKQKNGFIVIRLESDTECKGKGEGHKNILHKKSSY